MGESRITIIYALAANVVLAVARTAAGVATGSAALLAEAAHSTADTVDQVALLRSLHMGRRPADEEHPFGHGKERSSGHSWSDGARAGLATRWGATSASFAIPRRGSCCSRTARP